MRKQNSYFKYIALAVIGACALTACGRTANTNNSTSTANASDQTKLFDDKTAEQAKLTGNTVEQVASSVNSTARPSTETTSNSLATETVPTESTEPTATTEALLPDENLPLSERHGALRVEGAELLDQYGNPFQLYGMSTHGIGWFPQFVNYDSFLTLRDDWNTNCIRLAMYTAEDAGYCTGADKEQLKALVKSGVDYATELGMYVIIDWHILSDQDPNVYKEDAKAFFEEMSSAYAEHTNVLYEICNEPNGYATWDSVKSYAEEIIPIIRAHDEDAVIIVGTPTWSQDIDRAAANPLSYDNVMYALHFYAGTHKDSLRERLDTCVNNGLPVFISEFGMCDASGNGANDFDSTSKWMDIIEKHNLSFCCWNLANKDESSSIFKSSTTAIANWTEEEMNESGKWIRNYFRSKSEASE